jgi:D-alanyl-D-alanine carboxypeptidase
MHVLLCAMLAVASALSPQAPAPFTPAKARAIDALARAELRSGSTPGMAIGVVQDGLLVYARGFGLANLRTRRAVGAGTAFFTGSISEQFTAAAILLLQQQKKLALSDRVAHFVPELTIARNVTLAQLLTHTSGLPRIPEALTRDFTKPATIEDVLAAVNRLPAPAPPGAAFNRNALDYMLAGLIVQRVSGVPLSDFMQAHIFLPLIMTSTFLAGDQGAGANAARPYTRARGHFFPARMPNTGWLFGSSDLISSIDDMAKWDIGMPLLLNVDSVRTMWTANTAAGAPPYAMGWTSDQRGGHRFVWQSGALPGFRAMNAELPEDHIAVIVLANAGSSAGETTMSPERMANRILDLVAPLPAATFSSVIVQRASDWLGRLQRLDIDRTQLTPAFSQYLTDQVVIDADLKSEGPLESIVPVESFERSGDTVYVFDVRFRRGAMRCEFSLTPDGKIDQLLLQP